MILLGHHVQLSSAQKIHFISLHVCVCPQVLVLRRPLIQVSKWKLSFLCSPCFAVFFLFFFSSSLLCFCWSHFNLLPPPKPNRVSLEARQLFADQLALLRQHSHTNTCSVCLGLTDQHVISWLALADTIPHSTTWGKSRKYVCIQLGGSNPTMFQI